MEVVENMTEDKWELERRTLEERDVAIKAKEANHRMRCMNHWQSSRKGENKHWQLTIPQFKTVWAPARTEEVAKFRCHLCNLWYNRPQATVMPCM